MKKIYKLFVVIALICTSLTSNAQVDRLSVTLLPQMPYANLTNPGIRVNYNGMFGFAVSNIDVSLFNSNLLYSNIYRFEGSDPVAIDGVKLINSLKEQGNSLRADFSLDFLNVGFRVKKLFFNIDWKLRFDSQYVYSRDFLGFFVMGNANYMDDNPADFNVNADANLFSELGVAVQYDINEKLTVGIRPKVLFGLANCSLNNERTKIYTDSETYAMSADIDFSIRGASIINREINTLTDVTKIFDLGQLSLGEAVSVSKNIGFGVDLGAEYIINEHFGVAAGVYDLGFIQWKDSKIKTKQSTGVIVNDAVFNSIEDLKTLDYKAVVNTMIEHIWGSDSVVDGGTYKTALKSKVQLQGFYQLNDMLRATLIAQSYIIDGKMYPSVTAAYSGFFFKFLNLTANYTYSSYVGSSVGAGIGFHAGPVNIYAATDNILILTKLNKTTPELLSTYNAMNVRFGLVFSIGKYQNLKSRLAGDKVKGEDFNEY